MVPEMFRGVWRRRSIAIDGGAPAEPALVVWLQARESFADLRIPNTGDEIEAFAGSTSWEPPRLTWHHTIDWKGGFAGYDCGDIEWDNGALIERGTFDDGGQTRGYEEVWDRVDGGDHFVAVVAEQVIVVGVGTYSLSFRDGRETGSTFDVRSARWSPERGWYDTYVFGAGAELPRAADAIEHAEWRLIESA
jgi:hypothetical protein